MTCATEPSVATEREDDPQPAAESAAAATKGPPSLYTPELAERILRELEGGRSLHDICRDDGIPGYSTVHTWVSRDYHGFAARYASAREVGYAGRSHGTIYTEELAERVLQELSKGRALGDLCLDDGMPAASTVKLWVSVDRDGFAKRYQRARDIGGRKGGHPTLYTPELAEYLLEELADGRTLSDVCRDEAMPSRATVRLWVKQDRDGFAARYNEAREHGFHAMADAMFDIADDRSGDLITRPRKDGTLETVPNPVNLNRARLQVDVRRWMLANALPKASGGLLGLVAPPAPRDTLAEVLKEIDGKTRGLPSQRAASQALAQGD
jgi:hypothetical protein